MSNSSTLAFGWSAVRSAAALPALEPGWVWLVGAGPGDPGLLTLHALNALQQADVIVYDALVDEEILKLARPGAVVEYAGKRGGKASPKQRDISLRLIELARADKRVVRLKGGDPFLFGRGGEEALALVAGQIPFRIVPGVSAGIGGLAYAGIPVTHRDVNHAVTFVTGHMAGGDVPDTINWRALGEGSPVIVIYMGLKHLPRISVELMAAGRNADEPVAIISQATTDRQQVLETTLSRAAADAEQSAIPAPALIVVGEAVRLRAGLDWLSAALHGRKLDPNPLGKQSAGAQRAG
jgi:uroporphyrin-III C-methyltransferase